MSKKPYQPSFRRLEMMSREALEAHALELEKRLARADQVLIACEGARDEARGTAQTWRAHAHRVSVRWLDERDDIRRLIQVCIDRGRPVRMPERTTFAPFVTPEEALEYLQDAIGAGSIGLHDALAAAWVEGDPELPEDRLRRQAREWAGGKKP